MRMRVLTTKLRVEIENEMRVFLESLNFEIEMRVSQKSVSLKECQLLSSRKLHHLTREGRSSEEVFKQLLGLNEVELYFA